MNKLKIAALLALAGSGFYTQTAQAVTYSQGDVLIGFRSQDSNITKDYLIDIGQNLLTLAAPGSTITIGNFGADLNTLDPNGWFTDGNTLWGVVGANLPSDGPVSPGNKTLYAGNTEDPNFHPPDSSYTGGTPNSQQATITNYNTVGNRFQQGSIAQGTPAGGGASVFSLQEQFQIAADSASWATGASGNGSGFGFGVFNGFEGSIGTGTMGENLDYYRIPANSGPQFEGTFAVASDGTITFTAPVPEPSALTALLGGAGVLVGLIRRRRSVLA